MEILNSTTQYSSDIRQLTKGKCLSTHRLLNQNDIHNKVYTICQSLMTQHGVHSNAVMKAAGFNYTRDGDTAHCETCGLNVSDWTEDMKPFIIHVQRSPTCAFVSSLTQNNWLTVPSKTNFIESNSMLNDERSPKRQKIQLTQEKYETNLFSEIKSLKEMRERTFSHWPHRKSPSAAHMVEAGFFNCNVGDRVICLYCNLICQQWAPNSDDPCEIHKIFSPKCPYVISKLIRAEPLSIPIVNENLTSANSEASSNSDSVLFEQVLNTAACHHAYKEIPKRYATFATWPNENLPSVDDLVRAGFFHTGTKTIVTCFYCNGSLQNWGANDNPMIEHARWFPNCAYIKQLCGAKEYQKIQRSNQRQKERAEKDEGLNRSETNANKSSGRRLHIPDESTLSRYVAARLDLPSSQRMLDQNFKLSIVKRCWEDQLRLKGDDFVSDTDLLMACTILKKQIDYINGNKENILIPSIAMKKLCEKEQTEDLDQQTTSEPIPIKPSDDTDVEMSTSSTSTTTPEETTKISSINTEKKTNIKSNNLPRKDENDSSTSRPCALCLTEEKALACMPCGHVATCVPCGHSLRSCPICRSEIKAFVRVYL